MNINAVSLSVHGILAITVVRGPSSIVSSHHRLPYKPSMWLPHYFIAPLNAAALAPPTEQLGGMKDCFLPSPFAPSLAIWRNQGSKQQ